MFGVKAGDERFHAKLNQFVVSKLSGKDRSYWIFHTRGEEAVSILISELTKAKISSDDVISIIGKLSVNLLDKLEWTTIKAKQDKGLIVYAWGTKDVKIDLHDAVAKGEAVSRVLGYEKEDNEERKT